MTLLAFLIEYVKNPFGDPWARKLRLDLPEPFSDPKYGTHDYTKVNKNHVIVNLAVVRKGACSIGAIPHSHRIQA
ncbi:hypothetical protein EVAR_45065_1 [Eumeta japonica]|uniref:Uncharacterized protein n=1 Tax=Eumeta variegata TaxID=151549 RepID=A0A4C1XW08_EUMVA|nr:hypothetical protein EVAR_45065_1 [Eumeta japonica]